MMQLTTWYNPRQLKAADLLPRAIVHRTVSNRIFKDLCESEMKYPEQHYLIEGEWGMGKTTLLLQLYHRIQKAESCRAKLIPLLFNEEEVRIQSLSDLWTRTAALLEEEESRYTDLNEQIQGLQAQIKDEATLERTQLELLCQGLRQANQSVLLLIDNFDQVLERFNKTDGHRLRKVLLSAPEIRLIGAISKPLDAVYDYRHPFYEFFKIEQLKPLGTDEAWELMQELGRMTENKKLQNFIQSSRHRIETFRQITGGNLRMMWLMFEQLLQEQKDNLFEILQQVTGQLRPYLKGSIQALSNQQQAILETLALEWEPTGVQSLSQKLRAKSKTISAQLNQLRQIGQVEKLPTQTKNFKYRLKDRILNLALILINGSQKEQKQVKRMVDQLESWQTHRSAIHKLVDDLLAQTQPSMPRPKRISSSTPARKAYVDYLQAIDTRDYQAAARHLRKAVEEGILFDQAFLAKLDVPSKYLIFLWLIALRDYDLIKDQFTQFEAAHQEQPLPLPTAYDPEVWEQTDLMQIPAEWVEWEAMLKDVMGLAGKLRGLHAGRGKRKKPLVKKS